MKLILKYLKLILCCVLSIYMYLPLSAQESPAYRSVPDSVTEHMKKEKDFLYANDPSYWPKKKQKSNPAFYRFIASMLQSPVLKWVVYIFLATIVLFAIYQVLLVNNFFIFSRKVKRKKLSATSDEDEMLEANMDEQINKAIDNQEYRLAIRYMYLKTLQLLNEKNRIKYNAQSTNRDYIRQMQQHSGAKEFSMLTGVYEYVWYGEYEPNARQFESIKSNFNKFKVID